MVLEVQDCEQIISEIEYEKDIRKYPDNLRRGQFKSGWEDAVTHQQTYSPITLQNLTWRNLGYRIGLRFGERSVDGINQIFERFARHYKIVRGIDPSSWQSDIEQWVAKHRKLPNTLSRDLVRFFELVFDHTQHPNEAWFGVHEQIVSLVVGNIFLAAIHLDKRDYGIWVLLDQNPVLIPKVKYEPVKSTQKYDDPLTWAHLDDVWKPVIRNLRVKNSFYQRIHLHYLVARPSESIMNTFCRSIVEESSRNLKRHGSGRMKAIVSHSWDTLRNSSSTQQLGYQKIK